MDIDYLCGKKSVQSHKGVWDAAGGSGRVQFLINKLCNYVVSDQCKDWADSSVLSNHPVTTNSLSFDKKGGKRGDDMRWNRTRSRCWWFSLFYKRDHALLFFVNCTFIEMRLIYTIRGQFCTKYFAYAYYSVWIYANSMKATRYYLLDSTIAYNAFHPLRLLWELQSSFLSCLCSFSRRKSHAILLWIHPSVASCFCRSRQKLMQFNTKAINRKERIFSFLLFLTGVDLTLWSFWICQKAYPIVSHSLLRETLLCNMLVMLNCIALLLASTKFPKTLRKAINKSYQPLDLLKVL